MKKVLFVSSLYAPHAGGVETMISEMARAYQSEGIQSIVLTKRWPLDLAEESVIDGVRVHRVLSARTPSEFAEVASWIRANEGKLRADVIHAIGMRRPMPLLALLMGRRWGVPVICTMAGGDIPDSHDPYPGTVWKESEETVLEAMERCDALTSVSKGLTAEFRRFFPDMKREVKDIYAGIDLDLINRARPERPFGHFILSLRRLDPTKGIHILIKAFYRIQRRYPRLQLVIAGDGPERTKLEALVSSLGLDDRAHFLGTVSLSRGMSLLKGADLTAVPSLSEAGGLVNVEAQAAGCPVVASDVGGIPEYVSDGESGLLFASGDDEALAVKISTLLDDAALREKLIKGGFLHSEKFSWKELAPQYLKLYRACIAERSKKTSPDAPFKPDGKASALWQQLVS